MFFSLQPGHSTGKTFCGYGDSVECKLPTLLDARENRPGCACEKQASGECRGQVSGQAMALR